MLERVVQQGIDETAHIANMIDDNIDYGLDHGNIMPTINIPEEFSSHEDYLHYLVFEKFDDKFGWMSEEDQKIRRERLEKELLTYKNEIKRVEKMLSNEGFVAKAPASKIEEEKAKKVKYEELLIKTEERISSLKNK